MEDVKAVEAGRDTVWNSSMVVHQCCRVGSHVDVDA